MLNSYPANMPEAEFVLFCIVQILIMTTTNIYVTFNGDCLQAFEFYKSAFGGDFQFVGKYGNVPTGSMVIREDEKEKIMHITFPISAETMLMGNDHLESFGTAPVKGDNFAIYVRTNDKAKADVLFAKLSNGGRILVPMAVTFWGSYYGLLIDKFGIKWKVNTNPES